MTTANKATATPAPWKLAHSGFANSPFVIYSGDKAPDFARRFPLSGVHAIAEIFHDEGPDHEQQRADANLIVLAPELLASLKRVIEFVADLQSGKIWDVNYIEVREARAQAETLITRVEGR